MTETQTGHRRIVLGAALLAVAAGGAGFWAGVVTSRRGAPDDAAPGGSGPSAGRAAKDEPAAPGPAPAAEGFEARLSEARRAASKREYRKAVGMLDVLVRDESLGDGEWRRAVPFLCDALLRAGRLDARRAQLEALPLAGLGLRDLYLLASLQNLKHKEKRLKTLDELGRRLPGDDGVRYARLHTLIELGWREEAGREVEALRSDSDAQFARWALELGRSHARAGDTEAVKRLARQVEETAADFGYPAPAFSIAGKLHALAGDLEGAFRAVDLWAEALGRPESSERAGLLKVSMLIESGEKDRASKRLDAIEGSLKFEANREMAAELSRRMAGPAGPRYRHQGARAQDGSDE